MSRLSAGGALAKKGMGDGAPPEVPGVADQLLVWVADAQVRTSRAARGFAVPEDVGCTSSGVVLLALYAYQATRSGQVFGWSDVCR